MSNPFPVQPKPESLWHATGPGVPWGAPPVPPPPAVYPQHAPWEPRT